MSGLIKKLFLIGILTSFMVSLSFANPEGGSEANLDGNKEPDVSVSDPEAPGDPAAAVSPEGPESPEGAPEPEVAPEVEPEMPMDGPENAEDMPPDVE